MDLIGISLLIIAIALVVLVVFVAQFFKTLKETVDEARQTIKLLTSDLDSTLYHTNQLLVKTNVLVEDINGKINTIDPLFTTLADLSVSVADLNQQARHLTSKVGQKNSGLSKFATAAVVAGKLLKGKK